MMADRDPAFWTVPRLAALSVLMLMAIGLRPFYAFTDPAYYTPGADEGTPLVRALLALVYCAVGLVLLIQFRPVLVIHLADVLVWSLVFLAVLSTAWSASPGVSLRRAVALAGTTLFACLFATRFSPGEQLRLLATALLASIVISFVMAVAFPAIGQDANQEWKGFFTTKNELGRDATLATLALLAASSLPGVRHRWLLRAGGALGVVVVVMSGSSAAVVIVTVCALIYVLARLAELSRALVWLVPNAVLLIAAGVLIAVPPDLETYTGLVSRDVTLTGRTDLWTMSIEMIGNHRWLGHGYSGFWLGADGPSGEIWNRLTWTPPHAHNGLLDLGLDLGLVGVGLMLAILGTAFVQAGLNLVRQPSALHSWPPVFLCFLVLYNITENTLLRPNTIIWVAFVSLVVTLPRAGAVISKSRSPARAANPRNLDDLAVESNQGTGREHAT